MDLVEKFRSVINVVEIIDGRTVFLVAILVGMSTCDENLAAMVTFVVKLITD